MPHFTTFNRFASKAIVHPQYQPEADGFMKLGDIKGEVSVTWREDGAGRFTSKRSNWDVICDVGTTIKQPADLRANGAVHQDMPMDTHPNDNLLGYPGAGSEDSWTDAGSEGFFGDEDHHPWLLTNDGLSADALVQQVNGTIGYEMQPVDFANNQVSFETGLPVEGIGSSNPMGIEPDQMVGVISRGDVFAAANELRSDNRF